MIKILKENWFDDSTIVEKILDHMGNDWNCQWADLREVKSNIDEDGYNMSIQRIRSAITELIEDDEFPWRMIKCGPRVVIIFNHDIDEEQVKEEYGKGNFVKYIYS